MKKFISVLLSAVMLLSLIPAMSVSAQTQKAYRAEFTRTKNHMSYDVKKTPISQDKAPKLASFDRSKLVDTVEAIEYFRDSMVEKRSHIKMYIEDVYEYFDFIDIDDIPWALYNAAVSYQYDISPQTGDAIRWNTGDCGIEVYDCGGFIFVDGYFEYYTTPQQDAQVTQKIDSLIKDLKLKTLPQIQQIEKIYNYLMNNIDYVDYSHAYDLYGALIKGKCVCQGYALAMQRLCKELGIDCKFVYNYDHGWNYVEYDGEYYFLDATWDDPGEGEVTDYTQYDYFMLAFDELDDHPHDKDFWECFNDEFLENYSPSYNTYDIYDYYDCLERSDMDYYSINGIDKHYVYCADCEVQKDIGKCQFNSSGYCTLCGAKSALPKCTNHIYEYTVFPSCLNGGKYSKRCYECQSATSGTTAVTHRYGQEVISDFDDKGEIIFKYTCVDCQSSYQNVEHNTYYPLSCNIEYADGYSFADKVYACNCCHELFLDDYGEVTLNDGYDPEHTWTLKSWEFYPCKESIIVYNTNNPESPTVSVYLDYDESMHDWYNYKVTKKATFYTSSSNTGKGSRVMKCRICGSTKNAEISPAVATLSTAKYTYSGSVKKPSVTVKNKNGTKLSTANYSVSYPSGRKNVGTYYVTVNLKGTYYTGSKKLKMVINPKGTSISKVTPGSKRITVSVKKNTTQTTGYQIQYSTSSKFSGAKTVTVSNKTTKKTIKSLKGKKKYYVRVRTYKTVGKTKYYSAWSSAKSVTTKR